MQFRAHLSPSYYHLSSSSLYHSRLCTRLKLTRYFCFPCQFLFLSLIRIKSFLSQVLLYPNNPRDSIIVKIVPTIFLWTRRIWNTWKPFKIRGKTREASSKRINRERRGRRSFDERMRASVAMAQEEKREKGSKQKSGVMPLNRLRSTKLPSLLHSFSSSPLLSPRRVPSSQKPLYPPADYVCARETGPSLWKFKVEMGQTLS